MAVALAALDAKVVVQGARGERSIPIGAFYRLPGNTPHVETDLRPGELITAVDLPAPLAGAGAHYLKIRDRNSFAFALVSVAAIIQLSPDKRVLSSRIALGGVAPRPWRISAAEQALLGKEATDPAFHDAAEILVTGAKQHRYNGFKVELARRSIVRALATASGRT
jgi:xanthine dehydrogenase YagS FAD-binding subunit